MTAAPLEDAQLPVSSSARIRTLPATGYLRPVSGSGLRLPTIENLRWETNNKGGFEAWHIPPGTRHRKWATYLGVIGKRRQAELAKLSSNDLTADIVAWVQNKRAEKGIEA